MSIQNNYHLHSFRCWVPASSLCYKSSHSSWSRQQTWQHHLVASMRLVTICGTERLPWPSRMPQQHGFLMLKYVKFHSDIKMFRITGSSLSRQFIFPLFNVVCFEIKWTSVIFICFNFFSDYDDEIKILKYKLKLVFKKMQITFYHNITLTSKILLHVFIFFFLELRSFQLFVNNWLHVAKQLFRLHSL